jgi:hypothetical protein
MKDILQRQGPRFANSHRRPCPQARRKSDTPAREHLLLIKGTGVSAKRVNDLLSEIAARHEPRVFRGGKSTTRPSPAGSSASTLNIRDSLANSCRTTKPLKKAMLWRRRASAASARFVGLKTSKRASTSRSGICTTAWPPPWRPTRPPKPKRRPGPRAEAPFRPSPGSALALLGRRRPAEKGKGTCLFALVSYLSALIPLHLSRAFFKRSADGSQTV